MEFHFARNQKKKDERNECEELRLRSHAKFKMSFRLMNYNLQREEKRSKCFRLNDDSSCDTPSVL